MAYATLIFYIESGTWLPAVGELVLGFLKKLFAILVIKSVFKAGPSVLTYIYFAG